MWNSIWNENTDNFLNHDMSSSLSKFVSSKPTRKQSTSFRTYIHPCFFVFLVHEILSVYLSFLYRTQHYVQWYGGDTIVQHSSFAVKIREAVSSFFVGRNAVAMGSKTFENTLTYTLGLYDVSEDRHWSIYTILDYALRTKLDFFDLSRKAGQAFLRNLFGPS